MKEPVKLGLSILLCEAVGIAGTVFTSNAIPEWYSGLNRPFFAPPNWVFGPVWTTLYAMMGISLYLVVIQKASAKRKQCAYFYFFAQLLLNFLWSIGFFGLRSPLLGLAIITCLWVTIVLTIREFRPLSRNAAYLLLPYLIWVSFAALLNASIAWLN